MKQVATPQLGSTRVSASHHTPKHNLTTSTFIPSPSPPPRPPLTVWSSAELRTLFRGGDDIYQVKKVLSQGFPLLPMFWLSETKKTWKIFFCTKMENESDCNCVSGWDNYGSRKNCLGGSRGIRRPGAWTLAAHFSRRAKTGAPGQSSVDAGSVGGGGGAMVGQVRHHQNLT